MFANCLNESRTSVSTFVVAFSACPIFRFGEADTVGAKTRLLVSLGRSESETPLREEAGCDGAITAPDRRLVCCSVLGCVDIVVETG